MRITTSLQFLNALRSMRAGQRNVADAEAAAATGLRVRTLSDAPLDASQIMRMDSRLRDIEQFRRNASAATTRMSAEDVVLKSVHDLLQQAKDLAATITSADPTDPSRVAALAQVRQIHDQIVSLGNTRVGNEYLFAGSRTDAPAFLADGTYVGDAVVRQAQIAEATNVDTNDSGNPSISDAIAAVDALGTALQSGTPAAIHGSFAALDAASQQVLSTQSMLGARLRQIQDTGTAQATEASHVADNRDSLRSADPAESLIQLSSAQSALERAYAAIGKVMNTNLLDFLT